jgi:hypothetical protein
MFGLTPLEFRRAFMRQTFFVFLHLVEDDLRKDIFKATNSAGSSVTPIIKLAATIRWLAGGMYIDICGVFGLSQVAFFHPLCGPLWPTIYTLDIALANMVVFNAGLQSCQNAAAQLSYFSRNMLQNCVCAVDGIIDHTSPYLLITGYTSYNATNVYYLLNLHFYVVYVLLTYYIRSSYPY